MGLNRSGVAWLACTHTKKSELKSQRLLCCKYVPVVSFTLKSVYCVFVSERVKGQMSSLLNLYRAVVL